LACQDTHRLAQCVDTLTCHPNALPASAVTHRLVKHSESIANTTPNPIFQPFFIYYS